MKSIFGLDEVMNMGNIRDDFTSATKELLANRVGRRCSNPACRKLTCGANTNPEKVTNIGVAAHICAAAQGGPRYDASMTPEERKSFENGIWLCQSCSKLIDTDITRYPKELLQSWKMCIRDRTGKVLFFGILHAVEVEYFIKLPHNTPYILL